jgi:hypothetical protein
MSNKSFNRRIAKIARNKARRKEAKKEWKLSSSNRRVKIHQVFLLAKTQLAVLKRLKKQMKDARE